MLCTGQQDSGARCMCVLYTCVPCRVHCVSMQCTIRIRIFTTAERILRSLFCFAKCVSRCDLCSITTAIEFIIQFPLSENVFSFLVCERFVCWRCEHELEHHRSHNELRLKTQFINAINNSAGCCCLRCIVAKRWAPANGLCGQQIHAILMHT